MRSAIVSVSILLVAGGAIAAETTLDSLICPCEVVQVDMYEDGGTTGGVIVDSTGGELRFCKDGRMRTWMLTDPPEPNPYKDKPWCFFLGASHPSHAGARELGVGSPEEAKLLSILRQCVTHLISRELLAEVAPVYRKANYHYRKELLKQYGLPEKVGWALTVHALVDRHIEKYGLTEN